MMLRLQTHPHKTKTVAMSPVRMGVRVAVVDVGVDAALNAAHAQTKMANRWTTRKPPWALLIPLVM